MFHLSKIIGAAIIVIACISMVAMGYRGAFFQPLDLECSVIETLKLNYKVPQQPWVHDVYEITTTVSVTNQPEGIMIPVQAFSVFKSDNQAKLDDAMAYYKESSVHKCVYWPEPYNTIHSMEGIYSDGTENEAIYIIYLIVGSVTLFSFVVIAFMQEFIKRQEKQQQQQQQQLINL